MEDFKPHSFDMHAFLFGMKCLFALALVLAGVRYGTALASERFASSPLANVAAAAATQAEMPHAPEAATPAAPRLKDIPLPKVTAKAFVIADMESGAILAGKDEATPHPIASISKLLTALVARDVFTASTTVTMTPEDWRHTEGSPGSIQRTDTFLASDLYYALLMESNNSVANAFARTYGEAEFIHLMLRKAHAIGMDDSLIDDPSGLSAHNIASARDLAALTRTVLTDAPDLFDITRTKSHTITAKSGRAYSFPNFNVFSAREDFLGGKTGYTDEALETMTTVFEVQGESGTKKIAIIVLHSEDRKKDIEKLLAWYAKAATSPGI